MATLLSDLTTEIKFILEFQYTYGIDTIFSYELDEKDNIVGQFTDG